VGFLSFLFRKSKADIPSKLIEPIEYKEYLIYPEARFENGQYRVAGKIHSSQDDGDELKEHIFIRSDVLTGENDANELMIRKAKMLIDQMGDKIFS